MLFLFPPNINDDFVFQDNPNIMEVEAGAGAIGGYLTWEAMKAAAVAAGSAVAPVAIGIVALTTIGLVVDETIGWDVVADYGQDVINHVVSLGGTVSDIFNSDTETVSLTSEFVDGAAHAVDFLPDSKIVDYGVWTALPAVTLDANNPIHVGYDVNVKPNGGDRIVIRGDYSVYGGNEYAPSATAPRFYYKYADKSEYDYFALGFGATQRLEINSGEFESRSASGRNTGLRSNSTIEKIRLDMDTSHERFVSISNLRMTIIGSDNVVPEDVIKEDYGIKESLPATLEDRKELMINNIGGVGAIPLRDNQAVTGVTFAEMASATTPEDLDEGSANDLGILGILTAIYNYIKSLPMRIVGAFTSLFNTIINAIKAIPDVITSGIDNLLININAVGSNIRAGFDDLLINLGGWADSLINGVGSITGAISDAVSGLLSGLGDVIGNGVGSLTDALQGLKTWLGLQWESLIGLLSNIWDFIAGLAEWIIALVVPTSLTGIQPSITSLTNTFNQKFEFIILPIKSFGNAYSESKSLYDVTFNLKYKDIDKDVHVLPIAFKPAVDVFRLVANGVVVVLTYISMYNRFRKEVLT